MAILKPNIGLGFDDVLIEPKRSDIKSRYSSDISTQTIIARNLAPLTIPIVSANMDTVTEDVMSITMALHGGLGIIHRFISPDEQAEMVSRVKNRMRILEAHPPTIEKNRTISDALTILNKRERGYIIVTEKKSSQSAFIGMATTRDFEAGQKDQPISSVMTKKNKLITLPSRATFEDAVSMMKKNRLEKVPVVDSKGKLIGVYTLKDYWYRQKHPSASLDSHGRLLVGAAIGVKQNDIERVHKLVEAGVDVLVLDIAHGGLDYVKKMLYALKVKEKISTPIIAGNIASAEGIKYLIDNGADGAKIGIGPGFVCETRDVAGVGVPQVTAIMEIAQEMDKLQVKIPIIADGGIRKPGDVAKALAVGADAVMVGSLFAGTDESPGEPVLIDGSLQKMVRGMASASAFAKRLQLGDSTTNATQYVPEGRTTFTPYKGSVTKVLYDQVGGLRSSMSYVGAHTISELHEKAVLHQITTAAASEQRRPLK